MIFQRAAQREFAQTAMAVFVALFAILLTTQLIRLLGKAASGATATEAVVALLGFAALNYLPVLLSLTLFISILLSLSRSYRDSEMAIWFSSGSAVDRLDEAGTEICPARGAGHCSAGPVPVALGGRANGTSTRSAWISGTMCTRHPRCLQ